MKRNVMDEARRKHAEQNGDGHVDEENLGGSGDELIEDEAGPIPQEPQAQRQNFPVEALPARIRQFVRQQSQAINVDSSAVALPTLAVLGGMIGVKRQVSIKPGKGGWYEFPTIWANVVASSGMAKSPAWEAAIRPVTALEAKLYDDYKRELHDWESREDDDKSEKPKRRRVLIDNVTIEWVAEALSENPTGLLLGRDELDGWVRSFNQYKSRGGSDLPNWLQLHRGGQLIVDRKNGTSVFVERATVSICGTTQPSTFRSAMSKQARASGLGARLLLAMLPKRRREWTEDTVDDEVYSAYERIVHQLYHLTWLGEPIVVPLSNEAKRQFIQFFRDWNNEAYDLGDDLAAAFAKLEAYAPRFALIHHLVTDTGMCPGPVSGEAMESGIALARWFGQEAKRVYAMIDADDVPPDDLLVQFIRNHGGKVTPREMMRWNHQRYPTADVADLALQRLVRARFGSLSIVGNPAGGRQSWVFRLM